MAVPHPIPYQGSKRGLARTLLACFPPTVERLVEPFAGSAALSLAAAQTEITQCFALNDANEPLIMLWDAILQQPQRLADQYAQVWHGQQGQERVYYEQIRAEFNHSQQPHHLLFLLARCVKASVRYNAQGAFNQSADHRRQGTHPERMRRHILAAATLLGGKTTLTRGDYRDALQTASQADLVYLDPPYQGVSCQRNRRYKQGVPFNQLIEALHWLNTRHIAYILSYDGQSGSKAYGQPLPASLGLHRMEIAAGRSAQATLLGRQKITYEAIYLSPAFVERTARSRATSTFP